MPELGRRVFGACILSLTLASCGGPTSRLIQVRAGTGSGEIDFEVKNASDAPVNSIFLAKSEAVNAANAERLDPDSPEGQALWGSDQVTGSAIGTGQRRRIAIPAAGRWEVRAVDPDGRYQHVTGLKLEAGGRYILEVNDGGWRVR